MSRAAEKLADLLTVTLEPPARATPRQAWAAVTPEQVDLAVQIRRRRPRVLFGRRGREVPR